MRCSAAVSRFTVADLLIPQDLGSGDGGRDHPAEQLPEMLRAGARGGHRAVAAQRVLGDVAVGEIVERHRRRRGGDGLHGAIAIAEPLGQPLLRVGPVAGSSAFPKLAAPDRVGDVEHPAALINPPVAPHLASPSTPSLCAGAE
jgi:hypothetical protein